MNTNRIMEQIDLGFVWLAGVLFAALTSPLWVPAWIVGIIAQAMEARRASSQDESPVPQEGDAP